MCDKKTCERAWFLWYYPILFVVVVGREATDFSFLGKTWHYRVGALFGTTFYLSEVIIGHMALRSQSAGRVDRGS